MFPSLSFRTLFPDPLLLLQDLRKQVAPLLKSFQGEVSLRVRVYPSRPCLPS